MPASRRVCWCHERMLDVTTLIGLRISHLSNSVYRTCGVSSPDHVRVECHNQPVSATSNALRDRLHQDATERSARASAVTRDRVSSRRAPAGLGTRPTAFSELRNHRRERPNADVGRRRGAAHRETAVARALEPFAGRAVVDVRASAVPDLVTESAQNRRVSEFPRALRGQDAPQCGAAAVPDDHARSQADGGNAGPYPPATRFAHAATMARVAGRPRAASTPHPGVHPPLDESPRTHEESDRRSDRSLSRAPA